MIRSKFSAIALIAASAALPTNATAQTAAECITHEQLSQVSVALLPGLVTQLSKTCATVLPPNASLSLSGADAAERYAIQVKEARPLAMNTIRALAGDKLPGAMTGEALFPFVEAIVAGEMEKMNKQEICPVANNLWAELRVVPMDAWGRMIGTMIAADQAAKAKRALAIPAKKRPVAKKPDFMACPYVATE